MLVKQVLARDTFLFEPDPELLAEAEGIGRRLQLRSLDPTAGESGAVAAVRLDSLAHEQVRSSGCERLSLSALEQLGFLEVLRGLGMSERDARIAVALVLARMIHPCSEREAFRWLREQSAALELLGLEGGKPFGLNKLHRICAMLWARRDGIEAALFGRERDLLGLSGTVVFFRLDERALYWPAGFPAGPFRTLETAPQRLPAGDAGAVAGCGPVSPAQRSAGRQCVRTAGAGGRHPQAGRAAGIVGFGQSRPSSWTPASPPRRISPGCGSAAIPGSRSGAAAGRRRNARPTPPSRPGRGARRRPGGWWRRTARRIFACGARNTSARDDAFLARHRARFEAALGALHDGLGKKNHTKRLDKVLQRLGRLRERYRRVHRQYDIEVQPGAKGLAARHPLEPQ